MSIEIAWDWKLFIFGVSFIDDQLSEREIDLFLGFICIAFWWEV